MADRKGEGYVYFAAPEGANRVKIGYSSGHPDGRLASLQVGCPTRLLRVGHMPGTLATERWVHDRLKEGRVAGGRLPAAARRPHRRP